MFVCSIARSDTVFMRFEDQFQKRYVILALLAVLVSVGFYSGSTAAAAPPTPDCGDGPDGGVLYVTDSGLEVIDDAAVRPAGGPFVNGTTIRLGNVTLSAQGQAALHLENASAPTVCLGSLNATATPVRLAIDGTGPIVLQGRASTLAVGPVKYDPDADNIDLAYATNASIAVRFPATELEAGTTVQAATASGTVLAEGTVDETGALALELPAGRAVVDLAVVPPPTPTPTPTRAPGEPTAPEIAVSSMALHFGNVTVGSTTTLAVTVANVESAGPALRVASTQVTGRDAGAFAVEDGAPFTLAPGEQREIAVAFTPESAGPKHAQLQLVSNATDAQIDVWLSNTRTVVRVQEVATDTDADPTAETIRIDAVNVTAGESLAINVTRPGLQSRAAHLETIEASLREGGNVTVNVTHSRDPGEDDAVFDLPDQVPMQYLVLEHSVPESAFAETGFTIRVNKSRFPAGAAPEELSVYRFANGTWEEQPVTVAEERADHYVYEVDTDGFSQFVVAAPAADTAGDQNGSRMVVLGLVIVAGIGLIVMVLLRQRRAESDEGDR